MQDTRGDLFGIDIENMLGCNPRHLRFDQICRTTRELRRCLAAGPSDTVIIACNPAIARAVQSGWPSAKVLVRGGPQGADTALMEALRSEVIRGHRRLVLCSGDGSLCRVAARARRLGKDVINVARPNQRHRSYRRKATVLLDWPRPARTKVPGR